MADQARGGDGRFTRTVRGAQRDAEAATMRARGATYQQIADALGYADRRTAYRAVEKVLTETVTEPSEELRSLELARLDAILAKAWSVMEAEHVTVSHGKIIRGADGQPLRDDGPVLAAIDRILKVSERRARLVGLDAPNRTELITLDQIDSEIRRLTEEMGPMS